MEEWIMLKRLLRSRSKLRRRTTVILDGDEYVKLTESRMVVIAPAE